MLCILHILARLGLLLARPDEGVATVACKVQRWSRFLTGREQAAHGRLRGPIKFLYFGRLATHATTAEHSARELASKQLCSGPACWRTLVSSPCIVI